MKMLSVLLMVCVCFNAATEDAAKRSKSKYKLLRVGTNLSTNGAKTGEQWLGLFKNGSQSELRLTTVKAYWVRGMEDPAQGPYTSRALSTPEEDTPPLFLVKGPELIKPGPILTEFHGWVALAAGAWFTIGEGKEELVFQASGKPVDGSTNHVQNYILELRRGNWDKQQVLISDVEAHDFPGVFWVGNLDGDNHLDFLMSPNTSGAGGGSVCLYLSTAAEGEELVHMAACVDYDGC